MTTDNKEIWLKTGYTIFALSGQSGLKIESLAKAVGISKSSFYHHFADIEVFVELLLFHHLKQSEVIAEKEKNVTKINPDLINILIEHKADLLFNRQLRFNRQNKLYQKILLQSNQIIGNEFIKIWKKDLNLTLSQKQLEGLFDLALENFYLQLNDTNVNFDWLALYFENLKNIAATFES